LLRGFSDIQCIVSDGIIVASPVLRDRRFYSPHILY
jgi:hypothetical protein